MKIDFSKVLHNPDNTINFETKLELESIRTNRFEYKIVNKEPVSIIIYGVDSNNFRFECKTEVTISIPCSRCLEDVNEKITINSVKCIDLTKRDYVDNGLDENFEDFRECIEGNEIDVDKLLFGEILLNLPMKVLCKEDCKGFCNRCGANLNHVNCGCDTTEKDPRMMKILDVFNSFKEV